MGSDFLIWQIADSAFPVGGFAHSGGLEAARQQGRVVDVTSLEQYIATSLRQAGAAALPFVREAYVSPASLRAIDRHCDALLSNHVANRASRAQGRSLLMAAERLAPAAGELRRHVREQALPGHLAPLAGALLRILGIPLDRSLRLFLFMTMRGLVSSAVRLGIVGPLEGQSLQSRLETLAERIAGRGMQSSIATAASTAPLLDILQSNHDRLYSRLFVS